MPPRISMLCMWVWLYVCVCYYSGPLQTLLPSQYDQILSIIIQPRALSKWYTKHILPYRHVFTKSLVERHLSMRYSCSNYTILYHMTEYLFGTPFTLITDHEPSKWLMQTNKTTGKLARWSLLLQEYDMKVIHRRGILNTNADCLSRNPRQPLVGEPILPDWSKGDYNLSPATVFAFMLHSNLTTISCRKQKYGKISRCWSF